jgi:hypothetical protein
MGDGEKQWEMIISFNTKAQGNKIRAILKRHNEDLVRPCVHPKEYVRYSAHEEYKRLAPGNELSSVDLVTFKRGWRKGTEASPSCGPSLARGFVFCNTGDQAQKTRTFDYLNWHLLRAMPGVYHDSFPAIAAYVCDDAVVHSLASRNAMADDFVHCRPARKPDDPMELIKPAVWTTRKLQGNPVYRELMMDTRGNDERRKRSREEANGNVAPYLSSYESANHGWTVSGADGRSEYFAEDSRERAEDHARRAHANWDNVEAERLVERLAERLAEQADEDEDDASAPQLQDAVGSG